jgi:hypothetical protein
LLSRQPGIAGEGFFNSWGSLLKASPPGSR